MDKIFRGSAKSVQLIRGQGTNPVALGNQTWEEAATYTVQFSIVLNYTPIRSSLQTICYAVVKWTVDGQDIQRVVSVGNGVSLTGVGQGVTIQVYDDTTLIAGEPTNEQYTVTATVSPGSRASTVNPPTYYPNPSFFILGAFGSGTNVKSIPVPANSGITSVLVITDQHDASTTLDVGVIQQDTTGNTYAEYNPLNYPDFVPLNPGANVVTIINVSNNVAQVTIVFGVDG